MCHRCTIVTEIGPRRPWWLPSGETIMFIIALTAIFTTLACFFPAPKAITPPPGYVVMDSDRG